LARSLITSVKRRRGQIHHRLEIAHQALTDTLAVPAQNICLPLATLFFKPEVQGIPSRKPGDRHHEVAPRKSNHPFDSTFVVSLSRATITVMDDVMR
jgi:hypothetical protein